MELYLRDYLANEHSLEKRREKTKEIFGTYTGFVDNLRATFNDRDELAAYLEWLDETFRDLFYKGLKEEVKKNMITHEYPATF
ncbi:hypothetical protein MPH_07240 [Macrophomina phaseolina MS6]|uniref:Uncharacterized protein n=1 Tax=Macrophomina phaseolina (strain MS6) TaxID=1126212 RepID=K2RZH2_MACPH|nr:hypothetical protein MPH_07240 [Macrophomina phaseolina MS6]